MKTHFNVKRMRWMPFLLTATIMLAILAGSTAMADDRKGTAAFDQMPVGKGKPSTVGEFVERQVVVRFESEEDAIAELALLPGVIVADRLQFAPIFLLQFGLAADPEIEAKMLAKKHGVEYAHPNFITASGHGVEGSRPAGDDPGGDPKSKQTADEMLDLETVHPITVGDGVKIGIIDGGIEFDHALFDTMTFEGYDFVGQDDYAYDEPGGEISGHGTFVAGILNMVAPGAELVPYRVIDANGQGHGFDIARALEQAVDDSCKLVNISIVLTDRHWAVRDAILNAEEHNVAVVIAAGNGSTSADCYPSAEMAAIAVAAVDSQYTLAEFSNYGDYIDVCAPGVDLYAAYTGGIYAWWSGTSFSTPCVTGQLALMAQLYPEITVDDYNTIIADKSIDMDQYNPGYEEMLGHGMINSYKAIVAAGVLGIQNNAFPQDTSISLTITPDRIEHSAPVGGSFNVMEIVQVESSNAPAVFYAEVIGNQNNFTTFQSFSDVRWTSGVTNGPSYVYINPKDINKPGVYTNTVAFRVAGVLQAKILQIELTMVDPDEWPPDGLVDEFSVGNYPNPFNPTTTISFRLPEASHVTLKLYDILGRRVDCLVDRQMSAGQHQVDWDGTNSAGESLSSGMYFYRIETDQRVETRKMILIK